MVDLFTGIYPATWMYSKYITLGNSAYIIVLNTESKVKDNNVIDMMLEYHLEHRISYLLYYYFLLQKVIIGNECSNY